MAKDRRVHLGCPNASNPFHECADYCNPKITEAAKTQKNQKGLGKYNGGSGNERKKKTEGRKVHSTCKNVSNPYHQCGEYCFIGNLESTTQQNKKESGTTSTGRLKKGTESLPNPRYSNIQLHNKVTEPNGDHNSSQSARDEITSADSSFDKKLHQSSLLVPPSGILKPEHQKESSGNSTTHPQNTRLNNEEECDKIHGLSTSHSSQTSEDTGFKKGSDGESRSFSSSEVVESKVTDEEEAESIIMNSDPRVLVGKYHVKANISPILKMIFHRQGDIAASCQLQSLALRTYYLECLSFVVQALQSTPVKDLKKSKLKEMLAILRDVESAQINISWLQHLPDQIAEALELVSQHRAAEITKENCEQDVKRAKRELESDIEAINGKHKNVADAKAQLEQRKARLKELQHTLSQVKGTMSSLMSKIEKIDCKALLDQQLL